MKNTRLKYAYWDFDELISALFPKENSADKLAEKLMTISQSEDIKPLNSGRSAIRIALKIFKSLKPTKTNVVLPSYTCDAVVNAIKEEGLNPQFVDIDDNLNISYDLLKNSDLTNTLAIIAVHNYGVPCEIQKIEEFAYSKGVFLIDDAAQIQGVSVNGKPLGSFGDFGIFSFAQSKTLVSGISGSGGALLINKTDYIVPCNQLINELATSESSVGDALWFVITYLLKRFSYVPLYYYGRLKSKLGIKRRVPVINISKISRVNASIVLCQFSKLNEILDDKKSSVLAYRKASKNLEGINFIQDQRTSHLTKLMLKIHPKNSPEEIKKRMKLKGIETRLPYNIPWADNNTDCEMAIKFAAQMIEVPINASMSEKDIKFVLEAFQDANGCTRNQS